jgi:hypothetical protein
VVTNTSPNYAGDVSLAYRFELYNAAATLVQAGTVSAGAGTTSYTVPISLQANTSYQWQARAEYQGAVGPWSPRVSFVSPLPAPPPNPPSPGPPSPGPSPPPCTTCPTHGTYSTSFPSSENPISEGGNWAGGGSVGGDWTNVRTTSGLAFGTQSGNDGYNDSVAILQGTWRPDQSASATVHTVNQQGGNVFQEVELLLRWSISPHSARGYEINYRCTRDGSQYTQIVRWNGPLGSFTLLDSRTGPGLSDGDRVMATAVGSTITTYINGAAIFSVTDGTYTSGNPGMGFYLQGASGVNSDFGFTSFTASDTGGGGVQLSSGVRPSVGVQLPPPGSRAIGPISGKRRTPGR